jgi:DNA-directed RNA polymerase specialized sigma24 family protein
VTDSAAVEGLIRQHFRRLYVYLRALLPGSDPEAALLETVERIRRMADRSAADRFADWADGVAVQVAADWRKKLFVVPFSDDLFRQLADSARPILDQCDRRPEVLARVLGQLPPPERELLERKYTFFLPAEELAGAYGRTTAEVVRDLTAVRGTLVAAVREGLPDTGPPPSGGAADVGRLADQLLDGTITEDGRLVLETLLLADAAAQAHYHRHAALAADLTWHYAGPRRFPELPAPVARRTVSTREWLVTAAFVVAVLAVAVFVVVRLTR